MKLNTLKHEVLLLLLGSYARTIISIVLY